MTSRRRSSLVAAFRNSQIWSRIDRPSGHEHLEINVRADRNSSSSNDAELFACRDGSFALSKRWGGHTQMTVNCNEAIVLHQDFESPWPLLLDTDHLGRRRRHDFRTRRQRRQRLLVRWLSRRFISG
jgi:hypothetical protein